jgi:hypothetical protein
MKNKPVVSAAEEDLLVDLTCHNIPASLLSEFAEKIVWPYYKGSMNAAVQDLLRKALAEQDFVFSHITHVRSGSKWFTGEKAKLVKFRTRRVKKRYKKNTEYSYKRYFIEFPAKLNEKIEPHVTKDFDDADITSKETPKQEILNISMIRNKLPDERAEGNS